MKNADLDYNTVAIEKWFMSTASPNMEMSGKSTSVADSTHFINIGILCLWSNDGDHLGEDVLNSLDKFYWTGLCGLFLQACFEKERTIPDLHKPSHIPW